jgi:hypothetical protein
MVLRLANNPIIRPEMLPDGDGANINGPSLIRVPAWVDRPRGRYYLYFAHHGGSYIRMAHAHSLAGPWTVHPPGVLHLKQVSACEKHIASPDVHVDEGSRQIRMYFHGPAAAGGGQRTFLALSGDGLRFEPRDENLGMFYMRMFRWGDCWYGMAKGGLLYRSRDGLTAFEESHSPFGRRLAGDRDSNRPGSVRHVAARAVGDTLHVLFTRIGDAPESILYATIAMHPHWRRWRAGKAVEVLRPREAWEGADLPIRPSLAGAARGRENALRDPDLFNDDDGRTYLLYAVAGESGIAIAELQELFQAG